MEKIIIVIEIFGFVGLYLGFMQLSSDLEKYIKSINERIDDLESTINKLDEIVDRAPRKDKYGFRDSLGYKINHETGQYLPGKPSKDEDEE